MSKLSVLTGHALLVCLTAGAQPQSPQRSNLVVNLWGPTRLPNASFIPCPSATGIITFGGPSPAFTCGALTFDNFQLAYWVGGAAGIVEILGAQVDSVTGEVSVQLNPNLLANQDEGLLFRVSGGISQIGGSIGGENAGVSELACAGPIPTTGAAAFTCPAGTFLGLLTVGSSAPPMFSGPFTTTNPVYIFKDILTGSGSGVSALTQIFETPSPATLVINPASGFPGTSLAVTGSGFAPNETVSFAGGSIVTADASGAFTFNTREPQAPYGAITVNAVGQSSGRSASFLFRVTAHLFLNPDTGAPGGATAVQGVGFGAGEIVKVYWINPRQFLGAATADNRGSFLSGNALPITIPAGAPLGANAVLGVGQTTTAVGKGWITVQ